MNLSPTDMGLVGEREKLRRDMGYDDEHVRLAGVIDRAGLRLKEIAEAVELRDLEAAHALAVKPLA